MPTAFANLSFETAGATAGDAASWTWTAVSGSLWAPIGTPPVHADGFELGWGADVFFGSLTSSEPAVFAGPVPQLFDGFETGWSNNAFAFTLAAAAAENFPTGIASPTTETFDGFERAGWSVVPFLFAFAGGTSAGVDDFEGWISPYYVALPSATAATFQEGGGSGAVETFEAFKADQAFSGGNVTLPGTFTIPSHGFVNGDKVKFFIAIDEVSVLPSGLSDQITYFVIAAAANTFQVSLTSGGAAVALTDVGNGTNYVRTDVTQNWGGRDGDTAGSDP